MMAKMSILCPFLGEIISGDQGKLPHCPRVRSDPAPASSKSPLPASALPVSQDTSGERGGTSGSQLPCDLPSEVSRGASACFTVQCAHNTQFRVHIERVHIGREDKRGRDTLGGSLLSCTTRT